MGTDDLFHKRKERKAELLRRRRATKAEINELNQKRWNWRNGLQGTLKNWGYKPAGN
jgi:hypothetical protein